MTCEPSRAWVAVSTSRRVWIAALLLAGAAAHAGVAQAGQSPPGAPLPLTYEGAVQRALASHPRLTAARLRRQVDLASRDVAAERLNPEFRVELEKETPKEGYTVAVPWELGGKRARRLQLADAVILSGDAELQQVVAEVRADVRRAYYAQFVAERRQALLADVQGIAQRARDAAQARFDAGDVPRLEVLQAQLALADVENQAASASGAVVATRATLNAAIGLPPDAPTVVDDTFEPGPAVDVGTAVARARTANAELAALDRRIDEQRARILLAQALRSPDIVPEATLTRRAEPEFDTGWRAAVAVTIPVFTTHRAAVRVEEAALAQLSSERQAAAARIAGEVASASAVAESQRLQYVRYRDEILPQAQEVERMAEDAYKLGQTGIAAYLQALQAARDVRLRSIQAAADYEAALADLERAIGAPVP